jgi:hypothetical protein
VAASRETVIQAARGHLAAAERAISAAAVVRSSERQTKAAHPGGQRKSVVVAFSPTTLGARTGVLTISSAQGSSSTAKLTGSGFVQLTLTVSGRGTVRDDQGHTCSGLATCTTRISASDQASITLTATPITATPTDPGTDFLGWGDACDHRDQASSCDLNLTKDTDVSAKFNAPVE